MKKVQEDMKWQVDKSRREEEVWKERDKVMLSTKGLVLRERLTKKLTERYMGPYIVEEMVSKNVVKMRLPVFMRIHLVVNVSRIVRYRKLVKE